MAFKNLRRPAPGTGFLANYIDTAFNKCLFMWDSCFILQFCRYGSRAFPFQQTLDNLYAKQRPDGFITRELRQRDGQFQFHPHDPASTGPNVLAWAEWEYYLNFGDEDRLRRIFPVLTAYHRWLRFQRTWPDGAYWSCGLGCGMDNMPRQSADYDPLVHHGHLSWLDATLQALLSAELLTKIAVVLNREKDACDLREETTLLQRWANEKAWDERTGFYYDVNKDGQITGFKSIAAFWALLAGVASKERAERLIAHLDDPRSFCRPHRVPSISAEENQYAADGGYWKGAIWPPTNYMILRGLTKCGFDDMAYAIAGNHHENVLKVFQATGTVWENYAPESAAPGKPAKSDFVGWSGLGPVAVLFEYIFGLRPDVPDQKIVWDVRLKEAHSVKRYPFGSDGLLDFSCPARNSETEKPAVKVISNVPLTLDLRWTGGREIQAVKVSSSKK